MIDAQVREAPRLIRQADPGQLLKLSKAPSRYLSLQPTESKLSLCLAPQKDKANGQKLKWQLGNWIVMILFHQFYVFAFGLLQSIVQSKKLSSQADGIL